MKGSREGDVGADEAESNHAGVGHSATDDDDIAIASMTDVATKPTELNCAVLATFCFVG